MAPKKAAAAAMALAAKTNEQHVVGIQEQSEPVAQAAERSGNTEPSGAVPHIGGTATEVYSQLQVLVGEDGSKINDYVSQTLELMQATENPATPLLLRVRVLEFIGRNVEHLRDNTALKKIVTSLVKIVGGEDNTPQLLIATLQCFTGLGPVSMLDKRWEYLSREGSDVLMQVMLDKDAFHASVREAAGKALDSLTRSAFRSVVTKLIHWVSNDREEDDEEQLAKERRLAMTRLSHVAFAPSLRSHWTQDTQEAMLALIQRVLPIVDAREFSQLARVAAHLSSTNEKKGIPLLEAFLTVNKLVNSRNLESLAILGRFVGTEVEFDGALLALEEAGLLATDVDGETEHGMWVARVVLLAARWATPDGAAKLYPFIFQQLQRLAGDGSQLPANLTTLEALLFAASAVGPKKSVEVLHMLHDESLNHVVSNILKTASELEPLAIFAVKKLMQKSAASGQEAELLMCLHNVKVIAGSFAAKHLPMGELKESWAGRHALPAMKRARDGAGGCVLPHPSGSAKRVQSKPTGGNRRKIQRTHSRGGRH